MTPSRDTPFSGSYRADDVQILLKQLPAQDFVSVADKEALIQSGQRHYSEMLSPESLPSARYLDLFDAACRENREQMAADCLVLASLIAARRGGDITLVSLARAGTPVGVILKHLLARVFDRAAAHYSVSIIRDRGIDEVALGAIVARHAPESIVFVDGWTGKGVISRELEHWVALFNARHGVAIDSGLFVLSDLAGTAACAASAADYLIPSSILNATVSGLISRSILNEAIGPGDFHGCVYYGTFAPQDRSRSFADDIVAAALERAAGAGIPDAVPLERERAAATSRACLAAISAQYGIADINLVKPGIGEATRVLLRRVPYLLILRDPAAEAVAHLQVLAQEKGVPVAVDPDLPYHAVSLIRSGTDA
ncbi:RNA binding Pelota-like protein [Pseudoduganella lurida]|uniref:RNA binding Pelota-like protein n=1 Tax=Pseudoduganella lurida TaxID=1036180 RepID=A0A562R3Y2_9BURK|nr:cysteine protease StiP family protein [Pseudoduganella lurida]TWI63563.1 RNA binding Pelota-like protein [Pseudoduganella lurida]